MKHYAKNYLLPLILCFSASSLIAQEGDSAFLAKFEETFEAGGAIPAKDFVPEASMSGKLHTVRPLTYNDGLRNTYFIDTADGVTEITGTPALLQRIREIYALDYLRGVSKSEAFGKALKQAGKAKLESAAGILNDPVGTVQNVPKGASRFFGRIGEGLKGGKSKTEDDAVKGLTGVSKAKAKLALQLGVSPYTTNQELQQ